MQRSTQGNKNQQASGCIYSRPLLFVWALQFEALQEELDDTIMQWANQANHNKRLEAVLIRLQEANVMLNGEKCKFLKVTVKFLGQLVGTHTDPGTVSAVNRMAELTDIPDLWSMIPRDVESLRKVHSKHGWAYLPTQGTFQQEEHLGLGSVLKACMQYSQRETELPISPHDLRSHTQDYSVCWCIIVWLGCTWVHKNRVMENGDSLLLLLCLVLMHF